MSEKRRQTTPTFPDVTPEQLRLIGERERGVWGEALFPNPADRVRRLAEIVAFEDGKTNAMPPLSRSPKPAAKKYFVHCGYMHRHTEEFTDFQRALDYYVDHRGGPSGARLVGEGYDADCDEDGFHETSDGLTDEERARLEAVS